MEAPRLERKLVAILAADVEGYSRHMERDEAATLATLSAHRVIVDELVNSHHGRITGTAGDSVLAEFASVVEAVDCAVKIHDALAAANQALPYEHRLRFRIGINVGDVMVKDGDIFGDGVNIAARLEALAEPGGICISRGVRDHVRKMGRFAFQDLGEQSVKNIEQPIRAFWLRGADATTAPAPILPTTAPPGADYASSDGPVLRQQASPAEEAEFELTFWESIKESREPAEFAAYLERYPAGTFAALAESRRKALLEEAAVPVVEADAADEEVSAVELAFWDTVKDSANPEMYSAYLERYPEGAFAALAKVRLEEFGSSL
ncbi:MAG: adenylate/guanylate cyclase domain-containing protein [Rhodospirillales bacterium]|nr:adenylate/guanylate cyclase domain-containing protein [Rhodospirillales bacterium]